MTLHESGEMYLEAILEIQKIRGNVRSIDISEYMSYSKPSVSRAVRLLKGGGYIEVDEVGYITLTKCGLEIAEKIAERHHLLTKMLMDLGVEEDVAVDDACRIEHVISPELFDLLKRYVENNNE